MNSSNIFKEPNSAFKCVGNLGVGDQLTIGKYYKVLYTSDRCVYVINDLGNNFGYFYDKFDSRSRVSADHVINGIYHQFVPGRKYLCRYARHKVDVGGYYEVKYYTADSVFVTVINNDGDSDCISCLALDSTSWIQAPPSANNESNKMFKVTLEETHVKPAEEFPALFRSTGTGALIVAIGRTGKSDLKGFVIEKGNGIGSFGHSSDSFAGSQFERVYGRVVLEFNKS